MPLYLQGELQGRCLIAPYTYKAYHRHAPILTRLIIGIAGIRTQTDFQSLLIGLSQGTTTQPSIKLCWDSNPTKHQAMLGFEHQAMLGFEPKHRTQPSIKLCKERCGSQCFWDTNTTRKLLGFEPSHQAAGNLHSSLDAGRLARSAASVLLGFKHNHQAAGIRTQASAPRLLHTSDQDLVLCFCNQAGNPSLFS